jgi:hypothetical protein
MRGAAGVSPGGKRDPDDAYGEFGGPALMARI